MKNPTACTKQLPTCIVLALLLTSTGAALAVETEPLGFRALETFDRISEKSFQGNVELSNKWILDQLAVYKRASADYKERVKEMIQGSGDGGLGMGRWLTDPENVKYWDEAVRRHIGEEGYARIVALNTAFPPGSKDFQSTYGGVRRFESKDHTMRLNELKTPAVPLASAPFALRRGSSTNEAFEQLTRFGDDTRRRMFKLYDAFSKGDVDQEKVVAFNRSYKFAGGCALANTDVVKEAIAQRYLNALNLMAVTLKKIGF